MNGHQGPLILLHATIDLKSKIYQGVVQDLATLKDNVIGIVQDVPAKMLLFAVVYTVYRM